MSFNSFYTHKGFDTNFFMFGKWKPVDRPLIVPKQFFI